MASGNIASPSDTVITETLDGVIVSARIADTRSSSLRLVNIDERQIRANATGRTFPELMRDVPGVYSTSESGSFGDAKVNIRGFKQENISVLLNGIPISGLTSGSMYWNNWMGLSDATATIQLQKGIGNSMLSDNSVGGTINIITTRPSERAYSEAGFSRTGFGTNSAFFSVGSGALKHGWNFTFLGSHNWGSSYPDATALSTWSYYAVIFKRLNERNSIALTALGSPERHQQRSSRLSYAEVDAHGRNYNKNWGWDVDGNGNPYPRTLSQNTYFKPYFTLDHTYDNGEGIKVLNTVYVAIADGGGSYTESMGRRIASFLDDSGLIDWGSVKACNKTTSSDEHGIRAQNIMTDYLAGHVQSGLKSNVVADLGDRLTVDAGLHFQSFMTWEKERITDLLGADYWYEDYASKSLAGAAGRNPIKKVGEYVRTHNGREQHYATLYGIGTYEAGKRRNTVLTLGVSLSGTALRRWDAYNYAAADVWSSWTGRLGGSMKGGILHNLGRSGSLYANAAIYSRAPYANVFFSGGSNTPSRNITNEKNYLGEAGFRRVGNRLTAEVTAYAAYWQDKTLTSSPYKSLEEDPYKFLIKGLDALHLGVEFNATCRISRILKAEAFASLGEWRWKNDVDATIHDPETLRPVENVHIYSDGLHVGDAPQTQVGAVLDAVLPKVFSARIVWKYNDRLWADFDPVTRTDPAFRGDSYRIPGYHLMDAHVSWHQDFSRCGLTIFVNVNNMTNQSYIERSKDGYSHDKASFTGYWGNGRSFNFGVRITI